MSKQTAVVTGANRGLGLGTARALKDKGYRVVLTARSLKKAEAAAAEIGGGEAVVPAELDVGDDASVDAFVKRVKAEVGEVDILVNNAGAIFDDNDDAATLGEAFNNNTLGAYRLCQRLVPDMDERGFGRVVNVSSGMGALKDMGGGFPAYRISKTALNAVTVFFDQSTSKRNVKINAVCPGWVRTDMGGSNASRSLDEGVSGIVWAATLNEDGPSGGFFRDGEAIDW